MIIQQLKLKNQVEDCKWILNLLESKFFGTCNDHCNMRKNEKNVFCIDCNLCYCKHCVTGFKTSCRHQHRRLQICRYVYHDVVRLQDIQKYFDCSSIQVRLSFSLNFAYLSFNYYFLYISLCQSCYISACSDNFVLKTWL